MTVLIQPCAGGRVRHRLFGGRRPSRERSDQARRGVRCREVEVVDFRAFEDGGLLTSDVGREKQELVVGGSAGKSALRRLSCSTMTPTS